MEKQNITLSLPKALLKKAKIYATHRDTSLSALLRESLEEKVRNESEYMQAKKRQMRLLKKGFDLGTGGHIKTTRDELHARK